MTQTEERGVEICGMGGLTTQRHKRQNKEGVAGKDSWVHAEIVNS